MNTDVLCKLKVIWQEAFHEPVESIDGFFSSGFSPDRCRYLSQGGEPVSVLYWFDCEYDGGKLAYIYAVATHRDHRGKGLASRLLAETHDHLKALGYAGAVLKPADGLFPFYARLGYKTSGYIRRFTASAAGTPARIQRLSTEEFASRRQQLLPENAVVQEGAALDFLSTFAEFYASDDALVCLGKGEPVIFEYLGNPHSAPRILSALHIKTAEFPTSGKEIPFTMFYPLNCTKSPGYLGITLE